MIKRLINVVNPFPEVFNDNTTLQGAGGRSGASYDYNHERSKWVLEGIHDMFVSYGTFPEIGSSISLGGPITAEHDKITLEDAMAYAALYPQNAIIERLPAPKFLGSPITQFDFTPLSDSEMEEQLSAIYTRMINLTSGDDNPSSRLLTQSERSSYKSSNQNKPFLKLTSIKSLSSSSRIRSIRQSFNLNPDEPLLAPAPEETSNLIDTLQSKQESGLDFLDWSKNTLPSSQKSTPYYNARDENLYFVSRTRIRKAERYDIAKKGTALYDSGVRSFKNQAIGSLLDFLEIDYLPANIQQQIKESMEFLAQYGDRDRPPAPSDVSVWKLGVRVPLQIMLPYMTGDVVFVEENQNEVEGERPPVAQGQGGAGWKNAGPPKNKGADNPPNAQRNARVNFVSPLSPYQIAKQIAVDKTLGSAVVFDFKNLDPILIKTANVLDRYVSKLEDARITPSLLAGLNLRNEVEKFKELRIIIPNLVTANNLSNNPTDMIEFRFSKDFELKFIVHNGEIVLNGLGINNQTLVTDDSTQNFFTNMSKTAMAYFFYSTDIAPLDGDSEIPPWTQFLTSYTFPNPNQNSLFASKISQPKRSGMDEEVVLWDSIKDCLGGDSKKSASEKMAENAGDTKMFPSEDDLITIRAKKEFITSKELYTSVRSAIGSCDTGLSTAIKEAFSIYSLVTQKTRKKDLLAAAVVKAKDAIIFLQSKYGGEFLNNSADVLSGEKVFEFGKLRIDGRNIETYVQDMAANGGVPVRLVMEIEREVNRQISCIFDVIGEGINELILDPLVDDPGPMKNLVRDITKEANRSSKAYTVNFLSYKTPTRDPQKTFRKKVEEIIEEFLKQMILDVFKDVVKALLGCGPKRREIRPNEKDKSSLNQVYGEFRINSYLDALSPSLDLLKICEELDIKDISLEENFTVVSTKPPTLEQLRQFHEDISDICTKSEVEGLLEGNAPVDLVVDLSDMVTDNIDLEFGFLTNDQKKVMVESKLGRSSEAKVYNTSIFRETAERSGLKFADTGKVFGLNDNTKIRLRMSADSLRPGDTKYGTLNFDQNKLREYFRKIGSEAGIDSSDSSPIVPEEEYCAKTEAPSIGLGDTNFSLPQFAAQVEEGTNAELARLLDLCELFNGAFDGFDKIFFDKWNKGLPISSEYRRLLSVIAYLSQWLQGLVSDALGFAAENAAAAPVQPSRPSLQNTQIYQLMETTFGNRAVTPRVTMIPNRNPEVQTAVPQWSVGGTETGVVSFEVRNDEVFLYGFKPFPGDQEFTDADTFLGSAKLSGDNNPGGIGNFQIKGYTDDNGNRRPFFRNSFDEYNEDIASTISAFIRDYQTRGLSAALAISNPTTIPNIVAQFYVTYSSRIRAFNTATSKELFKTNGDPCVLEQRERIAISCLNAIKARIINFLYNIGPTLPTLTFGTSIPDTVSTMAGYLTQKFEYEMTEKNLFDIFLKTMGDVDATFSGGPPNEAGISFDISQLPDLRKKFQKTIELSLKTMIYNIGKDSEFLAVDVVGFQDDTRDNRYTVLLNNLLEELRGLDGGEDEVPVLSEVIEALGAQFDPRTWTEQQGLYFLPVPLINAISIIYYDYVIDSQGRLPAFKFYSERRVANADDTLITAINPQNITAFSERFVGYPLTVDGKTYFSDQQVLDEIERLEQIHNSYRNYRDVLNTDLYTFDGNNYEFFGYRNGALQYNFNGDRQVVNLSTLTYVEPDEDSSLSSYTDFFNPLYERFVPIFRALPIEQQRYWISRALSFDYNLFNNHGSWPSEGDVTVSSSTGLAGTGAQSIAWFERKRLMEIAGSRDLIDLYKASADIADDRGVARNIYAPLQARTPSGKAKFREYIKNQRRNVLDRAIANLQGGGSELRFYGTLPGTEGTQVNVISYPNPGQWQIRSGNVRLTREYVNRGNFQPPYENSGYRFVTLQDDILHYVESLKAFFNRLGAQNYIHDNTLDKVAISFLYYLTNSYTVNHIKEINKQDDYSTINKLKRHLGISTDS